MADEYALRWQISAAYHACAFRQEPTLRALFVGGYLPALLRRLRHLHDLPEPGEPPRLSAASEHEACGVWEGDTKYLGYMARDRGRFGTLPLADCYGEESNAYTHDND